MNKQREEKLQAREAELRAEFEKELAAQEKRLVGEFNQETVAALGALETSFQKEKQAALDAQAETCQQLLEAGNKTVADGTNRVQAAYELCEGMFIKHFNLQKDMEKMAADHEEVLLNKDAEHQLELTRQAAEHAKAVQELHETHMSSMKTQEVGYVEKLNKKRRQVQALMTQVTEVNNFVKGYYKRYGLDKYQPPDKSKAGLVAAMIGART